MVLVLKEGKKKSNIMPLEQSPIVAEIADEVLRPLGVVYSKKKMMMITVLF